MFASMRLASPPCRPIGPFPRWEDGGRLSTCRIRIRNGSQTQHHRAELRSIYIQTAASVDVLCPRTSMRVALHYRSASCAALRDRVNVTGGIRGRSKAQAALRNADTDRA